MLYCKSWVYILRANDMKLKEKLHKLVYYSLNNWLFNGIY